MNHGPLHHQISLVRGYLNPKKILAKDCVDILDPLDSLQTMKYSMHDGMMKLISTQVYSIGMENIHSDTKL